MDAYDTPKYSPVIEGRPFRWSVGKYLGKRRIVVAWFEYEQDAIDYVKNSRYYAPGTKYDYYQSMF